jgi:hypothetical protein
MGVSQHVRDKAASRFLCIAVSLRLPMFVVVAVNRGLGLWNNSM